MPNKPVQYRRPIHGTGWLLYGAAWLPFALIYTFAVHRSGAPVVDSLFATLVAVGSAAVLGWLVYYLMPRPGTPWPRALAHHAVLAVGYAATWVSVVSAQVYFGAPTATWHSWIDEAIVWQFLSSLVQYALLAAAFEVVATVARLRAEEQRSARAEALRVTAELHALRGQLNPHFLFNSLHSIGALVREEPNAAEAALERLAACLRHVLDVNRTAADEIPLGDELAFVRDYLALERMRFGDRLVVKEQVDPDALDASVLAFVLQPLVENAIRHGLAKVSRPVTVRIEARVERERLTLEVGDDGPGSPSDASARPGVGLSAIRQRLGTRHGSNAHLEVTTAPGEGFRVRVEMPLTYARPVREVAPA